MGLRDHERHQLDEIAQQLEQHDPCLAKLLTTPKHDDHDPPALTAQSLVSLIAMDTLGLTAIVVGVASSVTVLIVLGIVITVAAPIAVAVRTGKRRHDHGPN